MTRSPWQDAALLLMLVARETRVYDVTHQTQLSITLCVLRRSHVMGHVASASRDHQYVASGLTPQRIKGPQARSEKPGKHRSLCLSLPLSVSLSSLSCLSFASISISLPPFLSLLLSLSSLSLPAPLSLSLSLSFSLCLSLSLSLPSVSVSLCLLSSDPSASSRVVCVQTRLEAPPPNELHVRITSTFKLESGGPRLGRCPQVTKLWAHP